MLSEFLPSVASPIDLFTLFKAPLAYLGPAMAAVVAGVFVLVRKRKRAALEDDRSVVAEYEPPDGLSPGQLGAMYDFQLSDERLLFAELAWLILQGDIEMEGRGEQATFRASAAYDPKSFRRKEHQHQLMKALFQEEDGTFTRVRTRGEVVNVEKEAFSATLLAALRTQGYVRIDPRQSQEFGNAMAIGIVLVGLGSFGWLAAFLYIFSRVHLRMRVVGAWALYAAIYVSVIQNLLNVGLLSLAYPPDTIMTLGFFLPSLPVILLVLIALVVVRFIPLRTKKGEQLFRRLRGFEDYLKTAEWPRAQYVEEKEGGVSDWSAYALALGLPSVWDDAFTLSASRGTTGV